MTPTPAPVSSSPFTASAPLTVPPVAPLPSFLKWVRRIDDSPSEGTSTSQTVPSVLLLDGGVSTFLENELARKGNVFDPPSLWSSSLLLTETGHDEIRDAHWAYGAAGANILSSVTYQCHYGTYKANPHKRTKVVEDDSVMTRLIRDGIRLAVEEGLNRYVAVSLGCYGAALTDGAEYTGDYHGITDHALQQFHARKLKTVLDYINTVPVDTDDTTGSDDTTTNGTHHAQNVLLAFETVPSVQEVHAIVSVLHQAKAKTIGRAVWLSLACSDGETLNDGSPIEEALDAISEMDPDGDYVHAIGINCCGVQHVQSLLLRIVQHPVLVPSLSKHRRALVCYPNSGEAWDALRKTWRENTGVPEPKRFAQTMFAALDAIRTEWKALYPSHLLPRVVLGGCCRTTPKTINALSEALQRDVQKQGYTTYGK